MKKRINIKAYVAIFLLGIIIAIIITEILIPAYNENKTEKELTRIIDAGGLPLPFPSFSKSNVQEVISILNPEIAQTDKIVDRVYEKIKNKYAAQIKAAQQGIKSNKEVVDYMEETSLLTELKITKEEALKKTNKINYQENYLKPQSEFARYNSLTLPENQVRYPAESEPIGAVLLAWPVYYETKNIWIVHANLVSEIVSEAEAWVLVPNEYWQKMVQLYLEEKRINIEKVKFIHITAEMVWTRDFGPTTVLMGKEPIFIGNPYIPSGISIFKYSEQVGATLGQYLNVPVYRLPVVIEGGNIISDGQGTIMMMESILLNNPDFNEEKLKETVKEYFGAKKIIILPEVPGEICGHVDLIVKFVDQDTLFVAQAPEGHHWHQNLELVAEILAEQGYEIIRLPLPTAPDESFEWSYLNSLTLNKKVVVPTYGTPEDETALQIYREVMLDYEIVSVDESIYSVGAVHCQTKEIPTVLTQLING